MATHYTTLGVAPGASQDELRRAYHQEARRWHPDRFANADAKDSARAEDAMRRVNEAWRVLGDQSRRRAYDRELAVARSGATTVGEAVRSDDGVPRIDPRLLDPEFLAARRVHQDQEIESRQSGVVRAITFFGFFGLLIGIFVFTAYADGTSDFGPSTTLPGPAIGVDAGDCVRQLSTAQLMSTPCDKPNDGRVIGARELDGSCPVGTTRELFLANDLVACVVN